MIRRREFVTGMAASGAAALLGLRPESVAAEPPPETTTIRLFQQPLACYAPLFVAEPLLIAGGFRRVEYVPVPTLGLPPVGTRHGTISVLLNAGHIDLGALDPPAHILSLDAGGSAVLLAGLHAGCYKLLASERIRTIRDLKGKTVAVPSLGRHAFVASMASYVGLDPRKDIVWANATAADSMRLFADGVLDAFMGFAPEPAELLARNVGHVLVDTLTDKPWSQYFCCILAGNREFVRKNPVATKRAPPGHPQGQRDLFGRPGTGSARDRGPRLCAGLRYRAPADAGAALWTVAGLRHGGHGAFLCPAPTRGRHDPVDASADHRAEHGLAVRQRAEKGTEGITGQRSSQGEPMGAPCVRSGRS